jgi:hypothetical protein
MHLPPEDWLTVDLVHQEIDEGKAMVDAAVEAGVPLFIYSSLPGFDKFSHGELKNVHHCKSRVSALVHLFWLTRGDFSSRRQGRH